MSDKRVTKRAKVESESDNSSVRNKKSIIENIKDSNKDKDSVTLKINKQAGKEDQPESNKQLEVNNSLEIEDSFPSCWGCQQDQPNQLAHMDPGGCLYYPESELED